MLRARVASINRRARERRRVTNDGNDALDAERAPGASNDARAFDLAPLKGSNRPLKKVDTSELPPLPPLPDLRELAKMASMDISDEEVADWTPKVHEIVKWFGALREIDLSDAEPYEAPGREGLMADEWLRDDEPEQFDKIDEMMRESQFWDGKFIKVAAVGGSAGTDFGDESGADESENADATRAQRRRKNCSEWNSKSVRCSALTNIRRAISCTWKRLSVGKTSRA